jgi:DDE superfamily endonuclease/Tc5 transposase DNA-binding domain/CENP-B N-terminal DNA-binding domain
MHNANRFCWINFYKLICFFYLHFLPYFINTTVLLVFNYLNIKMGPRANKNTNRARVTEKLRRQWNAREKLAVIIYHEKGNSKNKTALKFNIQTKQVRDWVNKRDQLLNAQPSLKRLNKGRPPKYPALEVALVEWVKERRNNQQAVTRQMIQAKARSSAQQQEWQDIYLDVQYFMFSHKWLDGFMVRNNLSNRRRTTIAQHLPKDLIEKQQEFLAFIMYRRIEHDYPLALIGNMDETPMTFDLPSNTTVNELGSKTVSIRTTGHERTNFTVVLTCMADGTKLPPIVIFKLKNIPRGNFPSGVIVRANPTGWMNENEMLYWIENVWAKRAERSFSPRSLLVLDSFAAHVVDSVKRRFIEKNTNIAVIPGGLTSRLQPLDVSINKSFKSKVRI